VPEKMQRKTAETLRQIVREMRRCSRYKSHDLGYEDSVSSNRVDDWADELTELLCDCETSGNPDKPKQHGADSHAKNCHVYAD
jgi:hypothetical protein